MCKVGCGREQNTGKGDTPGFPSRKKDCIEKDHRGITKVFLRRNHPRVNQTSLFALQSWRANCDVQVLLYKGDPNKPDIMEIASIVDYVIAYCNKGNATQKEELRQTREDLVMNSTEITGCQKDMIRLSRQVLNSASSSRLISLQEATVMLASMPFTHCTETVESVSISNSQMLQVQGTGGSTSNDLLTQYKDRLCGLTCETELYHFVM